MKKWIGYKEEWVEVEGPAEFDENGKEKEKAKTLKKTFNGVEIGYTGDLTTDKNLPFK